VQTSQLVDGVPAFIKLPFASDFLLLPGARVYQSTVRPGLAVEGNGSAGAVYGIRINDISAPVLPFATDGDPGSLAPMVVFEGTVTEFYIEPLNPIAVADPNPPQFLIGKDCDIGFAHSIYEL
jgi:hypothetical protein